MVRHLHRILEPLRALAPRRGHALAASDLGAVCLLKPEHLSWRSGDKGRVRMVRRQLKSVLPRNLKRRLAGILYADIARYSRLTEEDEEGTHRRFIMAMEIMTAHIRAHQGRIAHYAGDAVLAEFKDATSTLHCAIDVQTNIAAWNTRVAPNNRIEFRVGVNLGEIIADHGDIYGNAVNIAARLEGLADPGGICISDTVRQNISNRLPMSYESLGEQRVKNISSPVRAFRIELTLSEDSAGDEPKKVVQLRSDPAVNS